MSAVATMPATRTGLTGSVLLALVPAAIVVTATAVAGSLAGNPYALGEPRAYQVVMNVAVLARFFGMFVSVVAVWGLLRSRDSSRGLLAVAILGGPVAYGFTAALAATQFFPLGESLYYGVNPMFVAAVASQCAMAAFAEMGWRGWRRHRGRYEGQIVTWRLVVVGVGGLAVVFATVLWQGGVPYFFWYQRGYLLLFT